LIRLIGDPEKRYTEDPVRLLRAVRFAVKLGFRIHPDTEQPIRSLSPLLRGIPAARLFEETLKLFLGGCAVQTFEQLRHHGLFGALFPETETVLAREEGGFPQMLLVRALQDTDRRIAEDRPVTPGFLIAALLWSPVHATAGVHLANGLGETEAYSLAADSVISRQIASTALPRRFTQMAREMWQLQPRFARRQGRRPERFAEHPQFRAAYDFLLLRAASGEPVGELAEWWTRFQEGRPLPAPAENQAPPRRRRRRGGRRRGGRSRP
jgi:poly(A) polymerase